jgi:hypothetical protein
LFYAELKVSGLRPNPDHVPSYFSEFQKSYIIRIIKSRRMRWTGYVACMGDMRNAYKVLVRKPLGRPR